MRNLALILLCCALFSIEIAAQEVTTYTLEEAIKYAQKHHLSIQNSKYDIQDAEGQIVERRAFGIPQLKAGVSKGFYESWPSQILFWIEPVQWICEFIEDFPCFILGKFIILVK